MTAPQRVVAGPPLELFARALDSVADAVIITGLDERVVYWNAAAEALYGYTAAEAHGRHLHELIVPVQVQPASQRTMERITDGDAYQGEWQMQDRHGRRFPVSASTSVVLDAAGNPCNFIGVSRDASDERAAFQTAQTLASIVANSTDAYITCAPDGTVTWANVRVEELFGWPASDLIGQPVSVLTTPDDVVHQHDLRLRALQGEHMPAVLAIRRRRDGTLIEVSLALSVVRDERGVICGTSCLIRDLTVENELRREVARQTESMRARFEQAATPQSVMDMDGNFVAVNDSCCELLGLTREEMLQTSAAKMAHVSDSGKSLVVMASLKSGELKSASFEKMLRHSDGHAIPALVDLTVLHNDAGLPYGIASFVRDLTAISTAEDLLVKQQALFRALNRRASDVAIVTDDEMRIRYISPSVVAIFGFPLERPMGVHTMAFVHPDDQHIYSDAVAEVLKAPDGFARITIRIRDGAGAWRWIDKSITNCMLDPDIRGLVCNMRDITTEVRAQEELRNSESRYRAIAETAQEGIVVLDPTATAIFVNQKVADLLGRPLDSLSGKQVLGLFDASTAEFLMDKLRRRSATGPETYELAYQHPDGTEHTLYMSVAPFPLPDSGETGSLAMVSDVTDSRRAETELRRRAVHDALTDLPNRTLLTDRIDSALIRQRAGGTHSVALLFLDLDHFKLVNDSRGHDAGDQLLIEIGRRLQATVRPEDTVARLGGDEFAVLCENVDEQLALAIAGRLRACLLSPVELGGPRVYVDASIGIALSPPHTTEALFRFADVAMYEAKAAGRGQIRVFDSTLSTRADRRLLVMNALREALENDGLALSYQPVVNIETGRIDGAEALLRWADDTLGPISAQEVVTAADAMGLSLALDRWVLRRACAERAQLRVEGVLPEVMLSVNVSARSFSVAGLDEIVASALSDSGWPADRLILEVTESAIMTDAPGAIDLLSKLRAQGVSIAVDDFGTGYSSLAYLKRLPVSILKIDRSFIEHVTNDADSKAIAKSVVDLSRALGLVTVAEGIETPEQAAAISELGCNLGQGHLWSRAVPAGELAGLTDTLRVAF